MTSSQSYALFFFLAFVALVQCQQSIPLQSRVVEVEPVALDIIVPLYDNTVILFHRQSDSSGLASSFEQTIQQMKLPEAEANKTLFGICNMDKDQAGHLRKYDVAREGIKFITPVNHYDLPLPASDLQEYFSNAFPVFFFKITSPRLTLATHADLANYPSKYVVAVSLYSEAQVSQTEAIYRKIYHSMQLFGVEFIGLPHIGSEDKKPVVEIFFGHQLKEKYPASAVEALYNFTDQVSNRELADLLDFINTATIAQVSTLNEDNFYRVFGSQLDSQLLLIYRQEDERNPELEPVREHFRAAAHYNKVEQMKFERVLFAEAATEFLDEYFADTLLKLDQKFLILHTKTEYSSFQLRKFEFSQVLTDPQQLITFLEDVRMNRIDATYKSEPVPEGQQDTFVRKIVGYTFLEEVFSQQDRSVLVLFIDSKQPSAYQDYEAGLKEFAKRYHEAYQNKLSVGIFDLAKNEHQLLTIRNAPELVLFERTNKKQPKFFKGRPSPDIIRNFVNYEVKDLTIPDNFGQKILPLGGTTDL